MRTLTTLITTTTLLLSLCATSHAGQDGKGSITERRLDYRGSRASGEHFNDDDWGNDDSDNRRKQRPRAVLDGEQKGLVDFQDGCVVEYERNGERRSYATPCTDEQLDYADDVMKAERSGELPPSYFGSEEDPRDDGYSIPQITHGKSGATTVKYRNGCKVVYNNKGLLTSQTDECSPRQIKRADETLRK